MICRQEGDAVGGVVCRGETDGAKCERLRLHVIAKNPKLLPEALSILPYKYIHSWMAA